MSQIWCNGTEGLNKEGAIDNTRHTWCNGTEGLASPTAPPTLYIYTLTSPIHYPYPLRSGHRWRGRAPDGPPTMRCARGSSTPERVGGVSAADAVTGLLTPNFDSTSVIQHIEEEENLIKCRTDGGHLPTLSHVALTASSMRPPRVPCSTCKRLNHSTEF
jgi:hypothetical protein